MRRTVSLLLVSAVLAGACSGSSDGAATTEPSPTLETAPSTEPATTPAATDETTTTSTTTVAPTTTIDEAALLAAAEAAYLEAFEVGKQVLRDPDNPDNDALLEEHFVGANLDLARENLRLTIDGGFVARVNEQNPSAAVIVEQAEFVDDEKDLARLTVCEFNSDRIFEIGTAPDGGDSLRRDDPVTILITVRMMRIDGIWRSQSGTRGEEVRDEVNRCSDA